MILDADLTMPQEVLPKYRAAIERKGGVRQRHTLVYPTRVPQPERVRSQFLSLRHSGKDAVLPDANERRNPAVFCIFFGSENPAARLARPFMPLEKRFFSAIFVLRQ
jgi:hypothetical protein